MILLIHDLQPYIAHIKKIALPSTTGNFNNNNNNTFLNLQRIIFLLLIQSTAVGYGSFPITYFTC